MIGLAGAAMLAACSTQAASEAQTAPVLAESAVHPESGLEVIPLTVTTQGGEEHSFRVEVAATAQEQQRGLMFRTAMGADEGMIFPFTQPRMASFWMRNTVIPLDIIFIGPDGRIVNIAADTTPYSEESVRSVDIAGAVLELNAGRSAELGIAAGDMVEW
ncbi:DUF192 domain-containing protein [Alteraurantiacibacter aquimixticola]|uniref:DUF192 domain-containing protein n=2 Tax=Alteraurantiacibacter aquimixticola TaxID=2489173 RepID=A0A4T3F0X8_9SPHN|nr:DUF192 domain-containing protein [Alteraurantiacibacter aquimixticola]